MKEISSHKRINDILLGPLERPALRFFASHMPAWVTPDILTAVGFLGSVIIFLSYSLTYFDSRFLWLASLGFFINWFGDSLDGTLARYRNIQRPIYGFFVDHTTDALSVVLVFTGLGLSPYVRFNIASMALVAYLLLSILVFLQTAVAGKFKISYGKLGPTEVRLIAILSNTLVFFIGNPTIRLSILTVTVYDLIVLVIFGLLMFFFFVSAIRQGRELARLESDNSRSILQNAES